MILSKVASLVLTLVLLLLFGGISVILLVFFFYADMWSLRTPGGEHVLKVGFFVISLLALFFLSLIWLVNKGYTGVSWRILFSIVGVVIAIQVPGIIIARYDLATLKKDKLAKQALINEQRSIMLEHIELGSPTFVLKDNNVTVHVPITVKESFENTGAATYNELDTLLSAGWTLTKTPLSVDGCVKKLTSSNTGYSSEDSDTRLAHGLVPGKYELQFYFSVNRYRPPNVPCPEENIRRAIENQPFYVFPLLSDEVYAEFHTKLDD